MPLKRYIVSEYQQDPREYEDKLHKLHNLRRVCIESAVASHPP